MRTDLPIFLYCRRCYVVQSLTSDNFDGRRYRKAPCVLSCRARARASAKSANAVLFVRMLWRMLLLVVRFPLELAACWRCRI